MRGTRVHFTYLSELVDHSFPFDVEGERSEVARVYVKNWEDFARRWGQMGEVIREEGENSTRIWSEGEEVYAEVILTDVTLHRHKRKDKGEF